MFIKFQICSNLVLVYYCWYLEYNIIRMNIASYFKSWSSKTRDLSDQSNDDDDYKEPREVA